MKFVTAAHFVSKKEMPRDVSEIVSACHNKAIAPLVTIATITVAIIPSVGGNYVVVTAMGEPKLER